MDSPHVWAYGRLVAIATSIASRRAATAVWSVLALLVVLEAAHDTIGGLGPDALFEAWIHNLVLIAATALCLSRALTRSSERPAWTAIAAGLACWTAGSLTWSIVYGADRHPPYPSAADVLWLLWYPATAVGVWLLVHGRARHFEVHRWMDGVAVALIVVTWGAAVFLEPAIDHGEEPGIATAVTFAYPILDIMLIGGILGLLGLMGWRPGRTWLTLGAGCAIIAGADAAYAVRFGRNAQFDHSYDFVWAIGALVIAAAAHGPPARLVDSHPAIGWRVIILPLATQALAASIQVYALIVGDLGESERILTLVLLAVASVQIIEARPRAGTKAERR